MFCERCILEALDAKAECPVCKLPLTPQSLAKFVVLAPPPSSSASYRNLIAEDSIARLQVHCINYLLDNANSPDPVWPYWCRSSFLVLQEGCPAVLSLSERAAHEETCSYGLSYPAVFVRDLMAARTATLLSAAATTVRIVRGFAEAAGRSTRRHVLTAQLRAVPATCPSRLAIWRYLSLVLYCLTPPRVIPSGVPR